MMTSTTVIASQIVDFLAFSERLKKEMRHSYCSNRRQESVAEHTWQMALMAIMVAPHLSISIDILRVLKMIVVHDLAEAEVGDVSWLDQMANPQLKEKKILEEKAAIKKIKKQLPSPVNEEIYGLWYEYEDRQTNEAKFVKVLDDLEAQIQHNFAPMDTWDEREQDLTFTKTERHCHLDPLLVEVGKIITQYAANKMSDAGLDINAIRKRAAS